MSVKLIQYLVMNFRKALMLIFLFKFTLCISQSIPEQFIPEKLNVDSAIIFKKNKPQACEIESYLPEKHDLFGKTDYTKQIQKCLKENLIVLFPDFPLLINKEGLSLYSNSILLFQKRSNLIMKPNNEESYEILRIHNIKNVKILYPKIIGDRTAHMSKDGEWGMGIAIRSSENIEVFNPVVENCWGDGIYVGQVWDRKKGEKTKILPISKNISIYNAFINYNRRNGLSIVGVDSLKVYNSIFANTVGVFPKSGIDIEPGPGIVNNVEIINCRTYNNGVRGIDVFLRKLPKIKKPEININIENFCDSLSPIGIRIAGYKDMEPSFNRLIPNGEINVRNTKLFFNKLGNIVVEKNQSLSPQINIINSEVINVKGVIYKGKDVVNLRNIDKNTLLQNNEIKFY